MTRVQQEVIKFLENLVHRRFNLETLNEELSKCFGENVKAVFVDEENKASLGDWSIMFNSEDEQTYGYFDIYVLKMRNVGFDGADFYVTEVGYEFD